MSDGRNAGSATAGVRSSRTCTKTLPGRPVASVPAGAECQYAAPPVLAGAYTRRWGSVSTSSGVGNRGIGREVAS